MRKFTHTSSRKSSEPTQEQMMRHKNFNALSKQHRKLTRRSRIPLYRDPKKVAFIILLGIIVWLLFA